MVVLSFLVALYGLGFPAYGLGGGSAVPPGPGVALSTLSRLTLLLPLLFRLYVLGSTLVSGLLVGCLLVMRRCGLAGLTLCVVVWWVPLFSVGDVSG